MGCRKERPFHSRGAVEGNDYADSVKLGKDKLYGKNNVGEEILIGDYTAKVETISGGEDILNGVEGPNILTFGQETDSADGGPGIKTNSADCENLLNVP